MSLLGGIVAVLGMAFVIWWMGREFNSKRDDNFFDEKDIYD